MVIPGEAILEALPVAVYTTDAEGRITFYNQAAADLWGQRPALGSLWCGSWRLFHPDGRPLPHDQCPMAVALKEGRLVRDVDAVLERPDGTRVPFLPFPTPLRDSEGRIVGAVNLLVDLTDRRRSEGDASQLAAIVSSSDDAIVTKRLDGTITSWNAGAERIFGYTADEMIGEPITKIIPPELQGEEKDIVSQLSRGERIDHYETVRIAKDRRRVDISLTVSPLRDSAGRILGASKVARDISERKRAENVQRLLVNELSHRIKNTLATVQAIAGQTLSRARSPREFVSSFNGRIQALARVHGLLTLGAFQGADMVELAREQLLIGAGDSQRISCAGPSLVLDAQIALHLALVLHELGTNARKHGALSAPTGTVALRWELRTNGGRMLVLTWQESGGPKVMAPSARGFGSTLIEQSLQTHGGEVSMLYAETGVSCVITLPLPDLKRPALAPTAARAPFVSPPDPAGLNGARVLVIEDEALIAMALTDYLTEAGCVVVGPAQSLERAAALISEGGFDAALVDGNLSGRSVDSLALALTQKNIPFAFVSGYGREGLPESFREALLVEKPFTPDQVIAAIERLLARDHTLVSLKSKRDER